MGKKSTTTERSNDPRGALQAIVEMGFSINVNIMEYGNQVAINDALEAYPGEFTYQDIQNAVGAAIEGAAS